MPTITPLGDAMSSDEIQRLIVKFGIRPVSGGSGDGDDDGDDDGDSGTDKDDSKGAGSGKGDDKSGDDPANGLKSALDKERADRKTAQKELREASRKLADLENAGKSEKEKAETERDTYKETAADYRTKYRDVHAREVVRTEALQLGADPKRVDRIVKMVRPDLAFDDDDDNPTNVKQLLTDLKKSDEDLFKPAIGKADGGSGNGSKAKTGDFMRAAFANKQ